MFARLFQTKVRYQGIMKVSDKRKLRNRDVSFTLMGLGCAQMGNLYRLTSYAQACAASDR